MNFGTSMDYADIITTFFGSRSSLNWQHKLCKNPKPNPEIKTLFVDHSCGQPNGAIPPSPVTHPLIGSMPKIGGFPPIAAHGVSLFEPELVLSSLFLKWWGHMAFLSFFLDWFLNNFCVCLHFVSHFSLGQHL